jgi:hypothetical protein
MFDRVATMVDYNRWDHNEWHVLLLERITPLDVSLALFLMRIPRQREEHATVEELLRDPYITRKWRMGYLHLATTVTTGRLFKRGTQLGLLRCSLPRPPAGSLPAL